MSTSTPNLDLVKPTPLDLATENLWGEDLNDNFDKIDQAFDPSVHYGLIVFDIPGNAIVGSNITTSFIVRSSLTIIEATAYCRTAPTGQPIIFDINKNGTTIWSTQSNRLSITAGTNTGNTTTFNTTSLIAGDRLDIDIDQVGSGVAGANITVEVKVR